MRRRRKRWGESEKGERRDREEWESDRLRFQCW